MTAPPPSAPAAVSHRWTATSLGRYVLAGTDADLLGVWRAEQTHFPATARLGPAAGPGHALLSAAEEQLHAYLAGDRGGFDLPLAPQGTPFQQEVWERLLRIPRGATTTYGGIAKDLGRPRAAQAVGAAVGANPLSIVVPCHRVVGGDGSLTGYAGGRETKHALLLLEGALLA